MPHLQLRDDRLVRLLVHLGVRFDLLHAIRKPQRRHRLVEVAPSRTDGCDHHGLGVANQAFLQQVRQLRVAKRDEVIAFFLTL